jgi:hypothetical protein
LKKSKQRKEAEEEARRLKESEERNRKEIEAAYDLEVFKREREIETTASLDEQLELRRELLDFQRDYELSNTNLVESERLLIIEQYKKKEADLVKQIETQKAKITKQKQDATLSAFANTSQKRTFDFKSTVGGF